MTLKLIAFALAGVGLVVTSRQATAQNFFYVPPGYSNGYYYGIDVGHGVGFGYGVGVGVPVPPEVLMGSYTAPALPPQTFWNEPFPAWNYAPQTSGYASGQAGPGKVPPTKGSKVQKQKGSQQAKVLKNKKVADAP